MELWETLFAGCGQAVFAFPQAVNGVSHSSIAISMIQILMICLFDEKLTNRREVS